MFHKTKTFFFFLFIVSSACLYSQTDSFEPNNFYFENNQLKVKSETGDTLLLHTFASPNWYYFDLNNDSNDELIVIDSMTNAKLATYTSYIFVADTSFRLLDSVHSGAYQPVVDYNEELESILLVTGLPSVDSLFYAIQQDSLFVPVQYYQFNGFSLKNVSDDVYSTYLAENIAITGFLDQKNVAGSICGDVQKYRTAIFTGFLNYRKAGEFSLANKFMQQYYPCADAAAVKKLLEKNN
ncbi:MAG: hypothetical protein HY965_08490 [Ignavibacteriales bacterium]|nr:hypothetical protein [Ignavibacteriales bacterium]